jgi:hypothetical protein
VAGSVLLVVAAAYAAFEARSGTQMLDRICATHEAATENFAHPPATWSGNQAR